MNVSRLNGDSRSNSHVTGKDRMRPNHGNVTSSSSSFGPTTATNRSNNPRTKKKEGGIGIDGGGGGSSTKIDSRVGASSSSSSAAKNIKDITNADTAGSGAVDPLSPPLSPTGPGGTGPLPQNRPHTSKKFDFHVHQHHHRKIGLNQNQNPSGVNSIIGGQSQEKISLAQSLLASKQNILAQVSLTPQENSMRQHNPHTTTMTATASGGGGGSMLADDEEKFGASSNNMMMMRKNDKYNKMLHSNHDENQDRGGGDDEEQEDEEAKKLTKKMTLCDIEDEDFDFGGMTYDTDVNNSSSRNNFPNQTTTYPYSGGNNNLFQKSTQHHHQQQQQGPGLLRIHRPLGINGEGRATVKTMDLKSWRELKMTVVGSAGTLQEGWIGQGFSFDHNVPYGLVQNKGGPCGVLAVVQALVLRNLMFGSQFCDDEDDDLPLSEPITNTDMTTMRMISFRRVKAVVCALTEIIWRCAHIGQKKFYNKVDHHQRGKVGSASSAWTETASSNNELEVTEENSLASDDDDGSQGGQGHATICFSNASVGSELRIFEHEQDLRTFIHANLQRFDCVTLVYSAVLSRGIDNVQEDFDFPNSPLLGNHGYCSQELVNLLTIGKAISNVFDNQVALDEKILKGIEARSDIGFLSLFEHYDSLFVGNNLKTPKFPLWIVCSESHFSLLFSLNMTVVSDTTLDKFDLYYYDGLARQQHQIKLTIELNEVTGNRGLYNHGSTSSSSCFKNNNNNDSEQDEELVPPLEKCIRTKWKNASVDWNGCEPIL